MTLTVTLYKNKSENNRVTKTSYLTTIGTYTGVPTPPTDIKNPRISVNSTTNLYQANYMYIAEFASYYYVEAPVWDGNSVWSIAGTRDPLMTFSSEIRGCTGYIQRNENTFDPMQYDSMTAEKNILKYITGHGTLDQGNWNQDPDTWRCMLALQGECSIATSGVPVFVGSKTEIAGAINDICAQPAAGTVFDHNGSEFIIKAWRIPFSLVPVSGTGTLTFPGYTFPASVTGKLWNGGNVQSTFNVSLTTPATDDEPWKALSPAANYTLSFAPFGSFPIGDELLFAGGDYTSASLRVRVQCDVASGDTTLQIAPTGTSDWKVIASANLLSTLPCNGNGSSVINSSSGSLFPAFLTKMSTNLMSKLPIIGGISASIADIVAPSSNASYGAIGGTGYIDTAPTLWCVYHDFVDSSPETLGLPLHKEDTLAGYSGFTVCSSIHLDGVSASSSEKDEIERAFASGVIL